MHASYFGNRALCKKNLRIVNLRIVNLRIVNLRIVNLRIVNLRIVNLRIVNLMTHFLQVPNYQIDAVMSIALPTCWVHCQDAPTYATFDRRESLTEH
jgi:hypothetical protein